MAWTTKGGGAEEGDDEEKRARGEEELEPADETAEKATGKKKERAGKASEKENVENGDEGSADAAAEEKLEGDPMDAEGEEELEPAELFRKVLLRDGGLTLGMPLVRPTLVDQHFYHRR